MKHPFDLAHSNDIKYKKLMENSELFWENYDVSSEFRDLCYLMLQENPKCRLTMADLIWHAYMTGECATEEEFAKSCKNLLQ